MLTLIIEGSFEKCVELIQIGNKKGEALEFRLDLFEDLDHVLKLKSLCKLPVIFTLRKSSQGGKFKGNEREREEALFDLLSLRPQFVDLEYDCAPSFVQKVRQTFPDLKIICSYHDFEKTPDSLNAILDQMKQMPASIFKIATAARTSLDSLRLLTFVQEQRVNGVPIAGMCMGEKGMITRILAPVVGSELTYAFSEVAGEVAPGQVSLEALVTSFHFSRLNLETEIFALIGDPIKKSISDVTHNLIFSELKKNAVYVKIPLKPEELPEFFPLMKKLPFRGFSVTMPLKELVGKYLDKIDQEAQTIGAINTLNFKDHKWEGFNTDASGALDAIEEKVPVKDKNIVILGAGGAARALAYESLKRGGKVLIVNRTGEKAKRLAKDLGCEGVSLEEWRMLPYDILMNTTSVGMGAVENCLISEDAVQKGALFFDAITMPKETRLLTYAKNKGCPIVYGIEMFANQAVKQQEIWLNKTLDERHYLHEIEALYEKIVLG